MVSHLAERGARLLGSCRGEFEEGSVIEENGHGRMDNSKEVDGEFGLQLKFLHRGVLPVNEQVQVFLIIETDQVERA